MSAFVAALFHLTEPVESEDYCAATWGYTVTPDGTMAAESHMTDGP